MSAHFDVDRCRWCHDRRWHRSLVVGDRGRNCSYHAGPPLPAESAWLARDFRLPERTSDLPIWMNRRKLAQNPLTISPCTYILFVQSRRGWATEAIHHLKSEPAVGAAGFGPGPGRGKGLPGDGHALRGDVFETESARWVGTAQSVGTVLCPTPHGNLLSTIQTHSTRAARTRVPR